MTDTEECWPWSLQNGSDARLTGFESRLPPSPTLEGLRIRKTQLMAPCEVTVGSKKSWQRQGRRWACPPGCHP